MDPSKLNTSLFPVSPAPNGPKVDDVKKVEHLANVPKTPEPVVSANVSKKEFEVLLPV